jgi:hypothetical protein
LSSKKIFFLKLVSFCRQIAPSNNNGCLKSTRTGVATVHWHPRCFESIEKCCTRQVGPPRDDSKFVVPPKNQELFEKMRQSNLARRALISTKMIFPRERTNISEPWFPAARLASPTLFTWEDKPGQRRLGLRPDVAMTRQGSRSLLGCLFSK